MCGLNSVIGNLKLCIRQHKYANLMTCLIPFNEQQLSENANGAGHWGMTGTTTLLFIGSGVMTSLPLLWFNNAAKRLRLSTLGFFQYVAPSLQLMLGVFLYHEPFTSTHAVTFGFIWSALVVYSTTSLVTRQAS